MVFLPAPATRKDPRTVSRRGLRRGPVSGLAGPAKAGEGAPSQRERASGGCIPRVRFRVRTPQNLPLRGQRRFSTGFPIIPAPREEGRAPSYVSNSLARALGRGKALEAQHLAAA